MPDAARAVAAPRLGMGEGQTSLPAKHQYGLQIERNEGLETIAAIRAYMAELTKQLEEMGSPPPAQAPTVSEGGFATVFDIPLFAQLDDSQRECLSRGTEVRFARGEIILRESDSSNFFYVMLEGELRVTKFFGEQEIFLATRVPGEFFGEIPILLDVPNSVLIRAVADSRFFRLPRAGFWDLLRTSPPVAREMRTLATRLRNMEGYTQEREKLIQLGTMAAGLAHELNNPATAARRAAADLRQSVEQVQAPWQEIDVHEGIENTLIILGHKLRNVTVTRDFDRTLPRLCAYGGELNQVWTNLIDNAIYALGGTGRIDVRTRRDGEFFLVEIADNGSGIPPEARPHIFTVPFFTTKGSSGTGLGLVISHRIVVERHYGQIDFTTGPDGTQFNVRLPFESPAHA